MCIQLRSSVWIYEVWGLYLQNSHLPHPATILLLSCYPWLWKAVTCLCLFSCFLSFTSQPLPHWEFTFPCFWVALSGFLAAVGSQILYPGNSISSESRCCGRNHRLHVSGWPASGSKSMRFEWSSLAPGGEWSRANGLGVQERGEAETLQRCTKNSSICEVTSSTYIIGLWCGLNTLLALNTMLRKVPGIEWGLRYYQLKCNPTYHLFLHRHWSLWNAQKSPLHSAMIKIASIWISFWHMKWGQNDALCFSKWLDTSPNIMHWIFHISSFALKLDL